VLGAGRGEQASTSDMKAYGTSKLMTIMSNSEIVRRLKGSGVDSFICQPGMSSTPVYKKTDKSHVMATVLDAAQTVIGQTEERGAVPLLYAATAPEMAGKSLSMSYCAPPYLCVHTVHGGYTTLCLRHLCSCMIMINHHERCCTELQRAAAVFMAVFHLCVCSCRQEWNLHRTILHRAFHQQLVQHRLTATIEQVDQRLCCVYPHV